MIRGEHRPEHRGHRVEGAVGERQCLCVAFEQGHVEPFRRGPLAAALEQARHVVDADRVAAEPCGRDGRVAAAGCDVEHVPAGVEVGRVDELLGDEHDPGRDGVKVAARPGLLLPLLDGCQVGVVTAGASAVFVISIPLSLESPPAGARRAMGFGEGVPPRRRLLVSRAPGSHR